MYVECFVRPLLGACGTLISALQISDYNLTSTLTDRVFVRLLSVVIFGGVVPLYNSNQAVVHPLAFAHALCAG